MNLQHEHERYARDPSGVKTAKAFVGPSCPICDRSGPHNHSALVVEAFHRANENEARNFGLVTFSVEEIRDLSRLRAKGLNDRSEVC